MTGIQRKGATAQRSKGVNAKTQRCKGARKWISCACAVAVLMFSLLVICAADAQEQQWVPATELTFNHQLHVTELELECATCHPAAESGLSSDRLLPNKAACAECHDVNDQNDCALCHVSVARFGKVAVPEVKLFFSHKDHLTYDPLTCETCHAGVAASEQTGGRHMPGKPLCASCHEGTKAPDACSACHVDVTNLRPESHGLGWARAHGRQVRSGDVACMPCHSTPNCQECHAGASLAASMPPLGSQAPFAPQAMGDAGLVLKRVHDLNYRFTHGLDARHRASDCARCHEQDAFCADCHQAGAVRPIWHGGPNWGAIAGAVGTGGGEHARLARRDMGQCAACHSAAGDDPTCMLCHMDRNPGLGNDPKTHGSRFKSQVGRGDFHDSSHSMCFQCHTFQGPAGGAGFCGYCHGPK